MVKNPQTVDMTKRPLDEQHLEVVGRDIDWSEFQWGEQSMIVRDKKYEPLKNYKFLPLR